MQFEFATAQRIIFGRGTLSQAGALAREFGSKVLVVTGGNRARVEPLLATIEAAGLAVSLFPFSGEPEISTIEEGTRLGRQEQCDLVVSFGGGSAIDAGKAIAAMLANQGQLLDYLEIVGRGKALNCPPTPFIAIPTTAGTGSEVTRNSVISAPEQKVKVSLRSPLMLPKAALVDPELTHTLSAEITAATGLDALTQLIEPYVSSRSNPMTDALCLEGIRRVARSLPVAYREPDNQAAREDMALASLFSGLALANAGLGAVHGFAGPIGGMFPAPHGAVCAALLPHVMKANLRALQQRQPGSETLRRFDIVTGTLIGQQGASAEEGVDWVRRLVSDLKIPSLRAYGLKTSHADELSDKAARASSMKANPIVLTKEELSAILDAAL